MTMLEILGFIFLFLLVRRMFNRFLSNVRSDPDNFYRGYVLELGKSEEDGVVGVFFQAGKDWNKDKDTIMTDYHNFMRMGVVPPYIRSFVRKEIDKIMKAAP